jgi:hypothetical protein
MAKNKSAIATNPAAIPGSKGNLSAATVERQSSSARKREPGTRYVMANEDIGQVAGDVWQLLDQEGGQSLPAIKKAIDAPDDVVLAAIGWLAREDKLFFSKSGRSLTISLR